MMSCFLVPSSSSSSANSAPRFNQSRISPHFRWRPTRSFPLMISFSQQPNITQDAQVYKLLEDIIKHSFDHLHGTQMNLQYWNAIAQGSDTTYNGVQFKLHEAIPLIAEGGVLEFETELTTKGIPPEILSNIRILTSVRGHLCVFISKVHKKLMIIKNRKSSTENPLAPHIANIEGYISELKDSVHSIGGIANLDHFTLDKPMSDEMTRVAVNRIYGNVYKLDMYLASLVATYRRSSKMLQSWIPFTVGAIAVAALSIWIFKQSGPFGIMDSTVAAIKDFVIDHVKEPLTGLKDELSNKSMKRDMELIELEEVRSNDEKLRRMLLDFIEPTTDDRSYTNKSNEEILELVVERYAEQIKLPIRGILQGDLVQACLIQVHKLKLDFLTEKLYVNKIMRANALTFAIVAASPIIGGFSLGFLIIYKLVNRSERKGRLARRRLLQQIEWRLIELQRKGAHEEYLHGLLLYTLDQLYKATESSAKATHEWESVIDEITNLGEKLGDEANAILLRLKANYACLREDSRLAH